MSRFAELRRLRRECKGSALVEFTLVAPLLVSLMCGLAEFGQGLRQYHIMQKGVRDAARYLSRVPVNPPCAGGDSGAWGAYVAKAQNLAIYGVTTPGSPLFKSWADTETVAVPAPTCLPNPRVNAADLPQITVTATAPYVDLGLLSFLGLGPITLTVSHQQLKVS